MKLGMQRSLSSTAAESDAQMAMFDQLGPKAREAFNYWPREPNIRTFMRQFKLQWVRERLDIFVDKPFDDPQFDAEFAAYIHHQYFSLTGKRVECLTPRRQRPYPARSRQIKPSGGGSQS